jgi:hypothetical protein
MDSNANGTQKIVITIAILLGLLILLLVGYSLWSKAKSAEAELARKEQLDAITKKREAETSISLTDTSQTDSNFTFDSLTEGENRNQNIDNGQVFGILSTTTDEEALVSTKTPVKAPVKKPFVPAKKPVYTNSDRPLTAEEIRRIRQLPIDTSATGNLQNKLEVDSNGQYKAQYK